MLTILNTVSHGNGTSDSFFGSVQEMRYEAEKYFRAPKMQNNVAIYQKRYDVVIAQHTMGLLVMAVA